MSISSVASSSSATINPYPMRSKAAATPSDAAAKPDDSNSTASAAAAPASTAKATKDSAAAPSAVTSFTSGVLGLDNPSEVKPPQEENTYYTAGRVLAAAGTVGTIISLIV